MSDDGEDRRARFAALSGLSVQAETPEEAARRGVEDAVIRAIVGHRLTAEALLVVNGVAALLSGPQGHRVGSLQCILFPTDPGRPLREADAMRAASDLSDELAFPAAGNA